MLKQNETLQSVCRPQYTVLANAHYQPTCDCADRKSRHIYQQLPDRRQSQRNYDRVKINGADKAAAWCRQPQKSEKQRSGRPESIMGRTAYVTAIIIGSNSASVSVGMANVELSIPASVSSCRPDAFSLTPFLLK